MLVPKISSSLGSSQFTFRYQNFRFHLVWNINGIKMEPDLYQNEKNAHDPLKFLYRNQNRATRTGAAEPQEQWLQYRNRNWTTKTSPIPTLVSQHIDDSVYTLKDMIWDLSVISIQPHFWFIPNIFWDLLPASEYNWYNFSPKYEK